MRSNKTVVASSLFVGKDVRWCHSWWWERMNKHPGERGQQAGPTLRSGVIPGIVARVERQYNYGDGPQKMMHIQDLGQRMGGKLVYNHRRMLHQATRPFVIRWANIAPCDGLTPDNLLSRDTRRGSREVVIFLSRHMMYCHSAAIITIFRHNQLKVVFSSLGIKILLSKYRDIKYLESKILLTGILIISEYLFVGKVNIVLQRRRL